MMKNMYAALLRQVVTNCGETVADLKEYYEDGYYMSDAIGVDEAAFDILNLLRTIKRFLEAEEAMEALEDIEVMEVVPEETPPVHPNDRYVYHLLGNRCTLGSFRPSARSPKML